MRSNHMPEVAGDVATVTGSLVLDLDAMGVRECQSYSVALAATPVAGASIATGKLSDDKKKLTLEVWTSAFGVSATATKVAWSAIGR